MFFLKNKSLSFKLVLLFIATAIAMIIILRLTSGGTFIKRFGEKLQPHIQQYFYYISQDIGNPPDLVVAKKLSQQLKIKIIIRGPELLWSSDGQLPAPSKQTRHHQGGFFKGKFIIQKVNGPYQIRFITQGDREAASPWLFLLNTLLGILFVLAVLYYFLRRMISPLKSIQQGVKLIGSGKLDHRITVHRQDELGELSQEINAMADDVEHMLEAKRQLLLAISHELRSPITRAKVVSSLLDNGRLKEELEADLNEMEAMVAGLLEAEQLNDHHQILNLVKLQPNDLITDVINKYFSHQPIEKTLDQQVGRIMMDEPRLRFIIKNLLDNALKYRKQDSDGISIISEISDDNWLLIVKDTGIGIATEHIQHLTEPFYRVDPSRDRKTGGYGLGLYIIKMITEAHQGSLKIESELGVGTQISIYIPLSSA